MGFWCSGFGVLVFWVWASGVLGLGFLGFGFWSLKRARVQIWGRALSNKHFFKGKNRVLEGLEILKFLGFRVWGSGVLGLGFWCSGFGLLVF